MTALPIPASLTNTTWTAPAGTYTLPTGKTGCHGAVTVDLTACNLVDGGGVGGLLNAATDCTALTLKGAGGGTDSGRGPVAPGAYTYVTTSATTSSFVSIADTTAGCTVLIDGFTAHNMRQLVTGKKAAYTSLVKFRNVFVDGMTVGVEAGCSIDVDHCQLLGAATGLIASPFGVHFNQDAAKALLWQPGSYVSVTNSTVSGYKSNAVTGYRQGDSVLVESSCESFTISNCYLGDNDDSSGIDSKAAWGLITNSTIHCTGARGIGGHTMGNNVGPWNGVRSVGNQITIVNQFAPDGTTHTEAYQAAGIIHAIGDTVTLASGARLATTTFTDSPGSGAPGSYPRLGAIELTDVVDGSGTQLLGPLVLGDDATHTTSIIIDSTAITTTLHALPVEGFGFGPIEIDMLFGMGLTAKPATGFGFDGPDLPFLALSGSQPTTNQVDVQATEGYGFDGTDASAQVILVGPGEGGTHFVAGLRDGHKYVVLVAAQGDVTVEEGDL